MAFLDKVVLPKSLVKPTITQTQSGFFSKIDFQPILTEQPIEKSKELLFRGTLGTLAELQIDPLSLKAEPKKAISSAWETLETSVSEGAKKIWGFFQEYDRFKPTKEPSKVVGKAAEALAGVGGIVFSPISALFEGAKEIPVLGSVARLIELPFSAVGEGGAELGKEVVDKLPISDEAKDNVRQGVEEIFSLAGMLALGKITHTGSKKYNELKTRFGEKDANTIVNKAVELAETKKAGTPVAEAPKTFLEKAEMPEVKPIEKVGVPEAKPALPRVEGIKPSKIALSIEERAIEKKLTKGFEGKAGYDPITIKEQARLVSDLIKTDIERAKRMIKGEEVIPENLRGGSLLVGLEEFALKKNDVNLLRDLAKSPLVSETSRFGQEIRILAERSPESPVKIIQDVVKTRESTVETTTKKKVSQVKSETVKEIKTEIKKSVSKRPTWEQFIKEITCK